jgi:acyl carrier protein
MNRDEARALIVEELGNVAPEVDFSTVQGDDDLAETLDIDSLDFLNFITALHKRTGVNVPESDYKQMATLDGAIAYLTAKAV